MKRSKSQFMQAAKRRDEIMNAIRNQEKRAASPFAKPEDVQRATAKIAELNAELVALSAAAQAALNAATAAAQPIAA